MAHRGGKQLLDITRLDKNRFLSNSTVPRGKTAHTGDIDNSRRYILVVGAILPMTADEIR